MVVSKHLLCTHCQHKAHEYEGLEGGVYLSPGTPYDCPSSDDKTHDFVEVAAPTSDIEPKAHTPT